MAIRSGRAEWRGDLKAGAGTVSVASGLFAGSYSFSTRFEEAPGTNPEELVGAAHAACFSMSLSNIMAADGHTPESVATTARVHLRQVDGKATVAQIDLVTEGTVAGITQNQFAAYAARAKADCPISRALAAVPQITLEATLIG